ncbi:hypothetical protein ACI01nite_23160 [Acetobacter cibinongensis]|uniref:Transposase n=1 Tax=Acetobacter cibinongensis TaxID=146475 RepID=A0A0D6N675_9PROT|nr:transposase [Acetobacter cibinongensis]GBQ15647.1 hypothetical protein AA0482_1308 [Acetobacter cibinongensis NRIC 0482]GEL59714.1 hypothetical protein ACI01nite_23160 [Acetobacter cibinongensis]
MRGTLKLIKAKWQEEETILLTDLAISFFGHKFHITIDRKFRLIRKWKATYAAAIDGPGCVKVFWTNLYRFKRMGRYGLSLDKYITPALSALTNEKNASVSLIKNIRISLFLRLFLLS